MAQLRQDYDEFVARDAEVVAIGPEGQRAFGNFWSKEDMPFVGLADPTHAVAELYGQEVKWPRGGRMPALLVIDKSGRVVFRHLGGSMRDIPSNSDVLSILDELNARAE
jgi:peroxiredoxin Q/BCP